MKGEVGYPIVTTTGQDGGIAFVDGYKLNIDKTDVIHIYAMPEQEKLINALESGMNLKYMSAVRLSDENRQKILIDKKAGGKNHQQKLTCNL